MAFKAGQKLRVIELSGFTGAATVAGLKVGDVVTALSGERGEFIDITLPSGNPLWGVFAKRFEAAPEALQIDHPSAVYFVEDAAGDSFLTDDLEEIGEGAKVAVFTFSRLGTMKRPPTPAPVIS